MLLIKFILSFVECQMSMALMTVKVWNKTKEKSKIALAEVNGTLGLLNYRLSQKLKLLENCEFNHLIINLIGINYFVLAKNTC